MLQVFLPTIASFVLLFFLTKLMGNKQIAQMNLFDYIVGITIGSIAAEMATDLEKDTLGNAFAMVLYALAALAISVMTNKSLRARIFLAGKPIVLMRDGKLHRRALKKAHLDLSEFLAMARLRGYFDLSEVSAAVFEHNGDVSFLPFSGHRPYTPLDAGQKTAPAEIFYTVILDGKVQPDELKKSGKDEVWLKKHMQSEGYHDPKEVFLALAGQGDTVHFFKNEP